MQIETDKIAACILDMDGVVTDTARLHAAAWKRMFDEFLKKRKDREGEKSQPFDLDRDYREYVDGKPRYDGVESFLASRHISLPYGDSEDPPERETVCGLGNRKNSYFLYILEEEEVTPFASTIDFIEQGRRAGLRFALISASRNARRVLEAASLTDLFDVVLDGQIAAELDLTGKPAPDIFLEAARRLDVKAMQAVVIEDALAGVEAGKAGGFALTIGIDRHDQGTRLREAGADVVVRDLAELSFGDREKTPPDKEPPLALSKQEIIFQRLQQRTPAIFLDYDGTLTPIVKDPAAARLSEKTRRTIKRLAEHLFVAVISGRALGDIRRIVGIEDLVYAGSHGFEVSSGGGYFKDKDLERKYLTALDDAERELGDFVADLKGVKIERKPFALTIHYRAAASQAVARLKEKIDGIADHYDELKKIAGKKIFELLPAVDWDKGKALQALLEHFHIDNSTVVPIYIGDDTTDENAFRSIVGKGIGILVSDRERSTAASFRLRDPGEVTDFLERLAEVAGRQMTKGIWSLTYERFDPDGEKLREALCTLGNGYFASRGAAPESMAGRIHYPGTYMAGCYNRLKSHVAGQTIENESLVNVPNWLSLTFRLADAPWFETGLEEAEDYRQELDMAAGILTRTVRFTDALQRQIQLTERRIVSMAAPHLAGLEVEVTVLNWSGSLFVRSALDGRVANTLVERYRQLNNDHLEVMAQGNDEEEEIHWLQAKTKQSHLHIAVAGRTRFFAGDAVLAPQSRHLEEPGWVGRKVNLTVKAGEPLRIEKIVALYNSRDRAISESLEEARQEAILASDFKTLLDDHQKAWRHLWQRCGIDILTSSGRISQILNLHIFHLLQSVSVHSIALDTGIPPRGLHGEAYRGLIMWDELFVFPFFNLRIPDLTRALLQYRYRRLPQAKRSARETGHAGAMFPWQSGSNGREEAQSLHLNPNSGHWIPDETRIQRHINIAVAYNVWLYYQVSGDLDFMSFYGAEMIIEIARFWASLATYNKALDRYEIKGVMGPDEFHVRYPDAEEPGLNNNAYTNVMAVWVLCRALDILELLPPQRRQPLWENLCLEDSEIEHWEDISRKMLIVFHDDGIISQFEGYDRLGEFDWEGYKRKYGNLHRLDRILEAEDDTPDRYKISKQADVLMLFYLLSADELGQLFRRLGYPFEYETIPANIEYYLKRTSHGSTLSRVVHSWVLARSRREQSWHLFRDALKSDIFDIQDGTTHEGIHLGAMAGTVDLIQRCYTGLETREDALWFNPALPTEVKELAFNIFYRQHWLRVTVEKEKMTVCSLDAFGAPIAIGLRDKMLELKPGKTLELDLRR
jgi:alpha,alpha-trehalase